MYLYLVLLLFICCYAIAYYWTQISKSIEYTTTAAKIPCKRFTITPGGRKFDTLQVFSVNVAEIHGGLQWPLLLFGTVALHDSIDHNRNIIFDRDRGNYQSLTEKVRNVSLLLLFLYSCCAAVTL